MGKVIEMNKRQFAVVHDVNRRTLIDDFGCMVIGSQLDSIEDDPCFPKLMELP